MSSAPPRTAISVPPSQPKPAKKPCLLILSGREIGRAVYLSNEPLLIGRSDDCAISIQSDQVSRRHARVQLIFGLYFVTDLESTNGTYVNETRVSMQQLNDGDQIRTGDLVLKFVANHLEIQYAEHVSALAALDPLTQLYNKRHFDEALASEIARARQGGQSLSLIVFDLDHFKRVNDEYGHPAGDAALITVARTASACLASQYTLCRVGGEEFALVMLGAARKEALALAERIRRAVAEAPALHGAHTIQMTVSAGVAELSTSDSPDALFQRADTNLYAAKNAGRNRVA
ncbi:MAG TPA: GGDEF domain-containing protein [Polyangiaceae bacterium]|jgi:diguanylate cyclase (GGDEF)-like protein